MHTYIQKNYAFKGLKGLSDRQIEAHLGLYAGYVKNVNLLLEKIDTARAANDEPALSELTRRFAFEFNGMRLHEYYFDQFVAKGDAGETLNKALVSQFGSVEAWKADFVRIGKMRGIGWALLVRDGDKLLNIWVSDHELGHLAGVEIILAMDIWEHAFLLDYLPSERAKYIDAFFDNLQWVSVEARFAK